MASPKEYPDFILEQLSDLDEISFRAMMPNADMELPYDGAKQMIPADDADRIDGAFNHLGDLMGPILLCRAAGLTDSRLEGILFLAEMSDRSRREKENGS